MSTEERRNRLHAGIVILGSGCLFVPLSWSFRMLNCFHCIHWVSSWYLLTITYLSILRRVRPQIRDLIGQRLIIFFLGQALVRFVCGTPWDVSNSKPFRDIVLHEITALTIPRFVISIELQIFIDFADPISIHLFLSRSVSTTITLLSLLTAWLCTTIHTLIYLLLSSGRCYGACAVLLAVIFVPAWPVMFQEFKILLVYLWLCSLSSQVSWWFLVEACSYYGLLLDITDRCRGFRQSVSMFPIHGLLLT